MSRRPSTLIAFICALFLLGAQQAAYAHWIGHLGTAANAVSHPAGGEHRDDGEASSHICTTCAAFVSLNAAPPVFVAPIVISLTSVISFPDIPLAHVPAHSASFYTARAPPAVL